MGSQVSSLTYKDISAVCGYGAALCLGLMLVPQVWQAYRKRFVRHLSWTFLSLTTLWGLLFTLQSVLLMLHSELRADVLPMAFASGISFLCGLLLLWAKRKFGADDDLDTDTLTDGEHYLEMRGEMNSVRSMSTIGNMDKYAAVQT